MLLDDSVVTIQGGSIINNTATEGGGAVMMAISGPSTVNMSGGLIQNNTALALPASVLVSTDLRGYGGAVFIPHGNSATNLFRMSGGIIRNNNCSTNYGKGIVLDAVNAPIPRVELSGTAQIIADDIHLHYNYSYGHYSTTFFAMVTAYGPLSSSPQIELTIDVDNTHSNPLVVTALNNGIQVLTDATTTPLTKFRARSPQTRVGRTIKQ